MKTTDHATDHATDHGCCDVSLIEQLKSIPPDSREWIKNESGSGLTNIPYGRYCQEAAEALQKAKAEVERLKENLEISEENLASIRMSLAQEEKRAIHFQHYCKKAQDMYNYRLVATSEADERAEKAEAEAERLQGTVRAQQDELKFNGVKIIILQNENTALKAEVERLTNGFQGSCYCCEPVGIMNQMLEAEVEELANKYFDMEAACADHMEEVERLKELLNRAINEIEKIPFHTPKLTAFPQWPIDPTNK